MIERLARGQQPGSESFGSGEPPLPRRSLVLSGLIGAIALLGTLIAFGAPAMAQQRTPELIPGKKTLYQRVLTRTGSVIRRTPSPQGAVSQDYIAPMSPFYVYGRRVIDGSEWLEIGLGRDRADGWILAEETLGWNQTLTATIEFPTKERNQVLFFRRAEDLKRQLAAPNAKAEIEALIALANQGLLPENSPILAWEPKEPPAGGEKFYVQPILDVRDVPLGLRSSARMIQVASETLAGGQPLLRQDSSIRREQAATNDQSLTRYRAGVVFVIDTTLSMQPYIDGVRAALTMLYRQLNGSVYGQNIAFGIVGFQSDKKKTPGLDYNTRKIAPLRTAKESRLFLSELAGAKATTVSSDSFDEDSFAGIQTAITEVNWDGYDQRFIVLVTDAGSKEGKESSSGLYAENLRRLALAQEKPMAIFALHLLTKAGARDHEKARGQYMRLTKFGDGISAYYAVPDGSIDIFSDQVNEITDAIKTQLKNASDGKRIEEPKPESVIPAASPGESASSQSTVTALRSRLDLLGRGMQLQYLGRTGSAQAPRLVEAWITDRDPGQPRPNVVKINTLVTKNQLSLIADAVRTVLAKGEETRGRSRDFFNQLRMVSAVTTRLPQEVDAARLERLIEFNGINEYLEGLPYKSQLTDMTEQRWISMQASEQRELLDQLESKLNEYAKFNAQPLLWKPLDGRQGSGEEVMQIPLDSLP
ncbi:vWA domain-containing protein [Azospirillum palustre]